MAGSLHSLIGLGAMAALLSLAILLMLLKTGWAWSIAIDMPNHRSLHVRPVPRVGGCGVMPVVVAMVLLVAPSLHWLAIGAGVLAIVSQIDDRRGLSVRVRFAVHIGVAVLAVLGVGHGVVWPLAVLAVITLVWLTNLYNFMDGINGIAGGMAVAGFAAFALAAVNAHASLAAAAAIVSGAALGFLALNFPHAKIFLGDAGSVPLGFLAGALGFWGWCEGAWPVWFPALVFSPFIVDATVTLSRRALRGEKIWQAHREHYYQRLAQMNGSHVKASLIYYTVMLGAAVLALIALRLDGALQWVAVVAWLAVLALAGWMIDRRWREHLRSQPAG
ncbi:UDP-N-acetylmuramyl pentapeptide phosphotransferase/UDP-N-acetylglucosamine-1-phosphate transferase [Paraburkholderia eburnea]|uniref:UDP-N-acetylmuramyl pentapeptide phosphotransferase/UDP-N-acetylglucosamine-1-phosphate transferase n=1 Tax=Paraburkholderia eburnea TaxID=1189126 RepID=A0A2S4MMA5_9BURK|nr:glycosyltransferase family 4 protein [Paraburkholderia eburnea]POR55904.1 UDP-N-acetylmuramyl pentapeptide phosphotransferase/UDP-N-acetylglucosamine-1-phosphate transferase [Paraburkholderia eburnea]PRZ27031.1 UDP-N-acetylmuramyl pentapeptide phosphotransferase/UDP-N-acetylglucosamine-1-phosphate transferase [Paraburkholderia eburnea]